MKLVRGYGMYSVQLTPPCDEVNVSGVTSHFKPLLEETPLNLQFLNPSDQNRLFNYINCSPKCNRSRWDHVCEFLYFIHLLLSYFISHKLIILSLQRKKTNKHCPHVFTQFKQTQEFILFFVSSLLTRISDFVTVQCICDPCGSVFPALSVCIFVTFT